MKNTYIVNNGYYKSYIKDDLASFLIYFDFFSHGIFLPKFLSHSIFRSIFHSLLRLSVILTYLTKVYKLYYQTESLEDDAIIIMKGQNTWVSTVKLVSIKGKFKIIKEIFDKTVYLKEKQFYNMYSSNSSRIQLPKQTFKKDNIIEIEFIKAKNFQRGVNDGTFDLKTSLKYFDDIKHELKQLYGNKETLIHGDLWLSNIYINKDHYYLIDYSDIRKGNYYYDLYVLLYSIFLSFHIIPQSAKMITISSFNNLAIESYIEVDPEKFKRLGTDFYLWEDKKTPTYSKTSN